MLSSYENERPPIPKVAANRRETLHPHIELLAAQQPILVFIGLIVCGMLCCFFGYRTTHFLIDMSGFILFGLAAMLLASLATQGNLFFMGIGLLGGGLLGALLTHWIYRLGIITLGGGVCALLAWHFSDSLPSTQWILPATIAAGTLGGIVSLLLHRFIISLATSVLGGLFVVHGVFLLLLQFEMEPSLPESFGEYTRAALFALTWTAVSATGFLFQIFLDKSKKRA